MDQIQAMRVFACVVASGSFTRSAHSLSISRSAVTKHVQALEDVVRVKLLVRDTRSVSLTPEGAACYIRLVRLLAQVGAFHASIRDVGAKPES